MRQETPGEPAAADRERQPRQRRRCCPSRRGRSSRAASAGLSVSELNAEMTVETAMVSANCRKNWPVMPLMNAHGTNTALQHQADGDHRPGHLLHRLDGRLARRQAVLDVMLDRLDDDDGVVDHDADGQHQAEQRQVVQAEAERPP